VAGTQGYQQGAKWRRSCAAFIFTPPHLLWHKRGWAAARTCAVLPAAQLFWTSQAHQLALRAALLLPPTTSYPEPNPQGETGDLSGAPADSLI